MRAQCHIVNTMGNRPQYGHTWDRNNDGMTVDELYGMYKKNMSFQTLQWRPVYYREGKAIILASEYGVWMYLEECPE